MKKFAPWLVAEGKRPGFMDQWRELNLALGITKKAKLSREMAQASGIPMEVIYDGGLDITAGDLHPDFSTGCPPDSGDEFMVSYLDHDGQLVFDLTAKYVADTDMWIFESGQRKRADDEYWIRMPDYHDAFINAAARAKERIVRGRNK